MPRADRRMALASPTPCQCSRAGAPDPAPYAGRRHHPSRLLGLSLISLRCGERQAVARRWVKLSMQRATVRQADARPWMLRRSVTDTASAAGFPSALSLTACKSQG